MLKPWALGRAATIKSKKMGMMPRRGAIQWCRLRRDLPSAARGRFGERDTFHRYCLPKHTYLNERQRLT